MTALNFPKTQSVIDADERAERLTPDAVIAELRHQLATRDRLLDSRDAIINDLEADAREQAQEALAWKTVVDFRDHATTLGEVVRLKCALEAAGMESRIIGLCGDFADHPTVGVSIQIISNEMKVLA